MSSCNIRLPSFKPTHKLLHKTASIYQAKAESPTKLAYSKRPQGKLPSLSLSSKALQFSSSDLSGSVSYFDLDKRRSFKDDSRSRTFSKLPPIPVHRLLPNKELPKQRIHFAEQFNKGKQLQVSVPQLLQISRELSKLKTDCSVKIPGRHTEHHLNRTSSPLSGWSFIDQSC